VRGESPHAANILSCAHGISNATTGAGRVHSNLPIDDRPKPATTKTITVRARTGSGDIELFRAA